MLYYREDLNIVLDRFIAILNQERLWQCANTKGSFDISKRVNDLIVSCHLMRTTMASLDTGQTLLDI